MSDLRFSGAGGRAALLVVLVVGAALAAAAIPSPLYDVWRQEMGFSVGAQGIVFGVYAVTLIPALLGGSALAGRGHGWPLLCAGLALLLAADAVFITASGLTSLITARGLQGTAVGLVNAAANTLVLRLQLRADPRRASVATAMAVAAGLAVGALGSGLLAEYATAPTTLVFLVHAVVALALLVLLLRRREAGRTSAAENPEASIPEVSAAGASPTQAAGRTGPAPSWSRSLYVICCIAVMAAWALSATFLAVGPSYALELLRTDNLALAGGTAAALFALACLAEMTALRRTDRRNLLLGLGGLAAGAVGTALAFPTGSIIVLTLGAICCGWGLGLVFLSTLALVSRIVPEARRTGLVARFFALMFLANSLPVVGIGFFADAVGLAAAITVFAALVFVCALSLLALLMRRDPAAC